MTALLEQRPTTSAAIVEIRDARPDDVDAIHHLLLTDSAIKGLMRVPNQSLAETANRLEPRDGIIHLVAVVDGEVGAFCELATYPMVARHRHAADLNAIVVGEHLLGQGIGRHLIDKVLDLSDNWLQISRLGLIAWETNHRAIALYESVGFVKEGVMRNFVYTDGEYVNAIQMGRLRP